jgi:general secretion pathway protein G
MRIGSKARRTRAGHRGFSLIEMLVVISMIAILISIAVPMYNQSITRSKEARLRQNLKTLNEAIDNYSLDKKKAPQSLDDLVPGYIKSIPDDITGGKDWVTEMEDPQDAWDPNNLGIGSVHSGSDQESSSGEPYSSWKQ